MGRTFSALLAAKRENRDLKLEVAELERRLAELEGPPLPSGYPVYEIDWFDLVRELKELGLELMLKDEFVADRLITYTDETSWAEMVPFLTYPADEYVEQNCDCDNYAKKASADAAFLFKLEGCLQCWDGVPGRHARNLVYLGNKRYKLFEPNAGFICAGELFEAGVDGFVPKSWK